MAWWGEFFGHTFFFFSFGIGGLDGRAEHQKKNIEKKRFGWLVGWFIWAGLISGVLICLLHSLLNLGLIYFGRILQAKHWRWAKKKGFYFLGGVFSEISSGEPFDLPVLYSSLCAFLGTWVFVLFCFSAYYIVSLRGRVGFRFCGVLS